MYNQKVCVTWHVPPHVILACDGEWRMAGERVFKVESINMDHLFYLKDRRQACNVII